MITSADVITRVAALGDPSILPAEWTAVIADAYLQINVNRWGTTVPAGGGLCMADLGAVYLVAHTLAVSHPQLLPAGPVREESMRTTSYGYMVPVIQAMENLDTTPYGREFKRLRKQLGYRAMSL